MKITLNIDKLVKDGYITVDPGATVTINGPGKTIEISVPKNESKIPPCPHQEIIVLYHKICPMMPKIRSWPNHRATALRNRWKEHPDLEWWEGYFKYVSESEFLRGTNDRSWTADLEWIIKPKNFCKINEGKYHAES